MMMTKKKTFPVWVVVGRSYDSLSSRQRGSIVVALTSSSLPTVTICDPKLYCNTALLNTGRQVIGGYYELFECILPYLVRRKWARKQPLERLPRTLAAQLSAEHPAKWLLATNAMGEENVLRHPAAGHKPLSTNEYSVLLKLSSIDLVTAESIEVNGGTLT